MDRDDLIGGILDAWRRHNEISIFLLERIPEDRLTAVPTGSRGRDVARQFAHMDRVRRGWLHYHATGKRPKLPRYHRGPPPPKKELIASLRESGQAVEDTLKKALQGKARIRMFGGDAVRWAAYLISHESHHRGLIAIALKQSGEKLPETVSVQGLWGRWIRGK